MSQSWHDLQRVSWKWQWVACTPTTSTVMQSSTFRMWWNGRFVLFVQRGLHRGQIPTLLFSGVKIAWNFRPGYIFFFLGPCFISHTNIFRFYTCTRIYDDNRCYFWVFLWFPDKWKHNKPQFFFFVHLKQIIISVSSDRWNLWYSIGIIRRENDTNDSFNVGSFLLASRLTRRHRQLLYLPGHKAHLNLKMYLNIIKLQHLKLFILQNQLWKHNIICSCYFKWLTGSNMNCSFLTDTMKLGRFDWSYLCDWNSDGKVALFFCSDNTLWGFNSRSEDSTRQSRETVDHVDRAPRQRRHTEANSCSHKSSLDSVTNHGFVLQEEAGVPVETQRKSPAEI